MAATAPIRTHHAVSETADSGSAAVRRIDYAPFLAGGVGALAALGVTAIVVATQTLQMSF